MNSASDIQRFCFYPNTKNIYTFIGFSNLDMLYSSIKKQSLKSAAIDQNIYLYPYELNKIDPSKNTIPNAKPINDLETKVHLLSCC